MTQCPNQLSPPSGIETTFLEQTQTMTNLYTIKACEWYQRPRPIGSFIL